MARKTTTKTTVVTTAASAQPGEEIDATAGDVEVPERDPFAELLGLAADDDVTYTVTKMSGRVGDRSGYCGKFSVADLSLDTIRGNWGGGKYKIIGRHNSGAFAGSRTVEVMDAPGDRAPAAAPASQGMQPPTFSEMLAFARGGGNNDNAALLEVIRSQGAQLAAFIARPAPVAPAGPSFTEILALIKETRGEPSKSDPVELLLQGLKLGQQMSGGETSLADIAKSGLEMVAPLIQAKAAESAAARTAPAVARQPSDVLPRPIKPAPGTATAMDPMLQKLNWLRQQTTLLVHHASKKKDPELYAEVMLDNLPEFITVEEIAARMNDGGAVAQLTVLNPEVAKYAEWFEEFRVKVLEIIAEANSEPDEDGADDDDGTPGEAE